MSLVSGIVAEPRFQFPRSTRTSFRVFRNYKLHPQLVAFQKRFRLLELPLPEIRSEFDRHTSNAGMLQSRMPHLARFQEFLRLSTRRHRVLLRQSGGLKPKIPGPSRTSLLWLYLQSLFWGGSLLSGRASSTYKGIRKPEFQKMRQN